MKDIILSQRNKALLYYANARRSARAAPRQRLCVAIVAIAVVVVVAIVAIVIWRLQPPPVSTVAHFKIAKAPPGPYVATVTETAASKESRNCAKVAQIGAVLLAFQYLSSTGRNDGSTM